MKYAGLIAAAGDSTRMGSPKALLPIGNSTFVEHLILVFSQARLEPIIVTLPTDIKIHTHATCIKNSFPHLGYMGSIKSALSILPDIDGLIICPVDCPLISPELIREMIKHDGHIIIPTYHKQRGHPIAISSSLLYLLTDDGLEKFLQNRHDVIEIPWHNNSILSNINYPDEYLQIHHARKVQPPLSTSQTQNHISLVSK